METIQVAIRIRPFLPYENETNTTIDVSSEDDRQIQIQRGKKKFKGFFDKIFSQKSTQDKVFKFISPIFYSIYKGINVTILAYGQTGSGKTYTMFGEDWTEKFDNLNIKKNLQSNEYNFLINKNFIINPYSDSNGIIPRIIIELFNKNNSNIEISCSYIQVYNEKIYDLLIDNNNNNNNNKRKSFDLGIFNNRTEKIISQEPLKLRDDAYKGVIIEGAFQINVNSFYDVFQLLKIGENNRKKRQTNKNDMSSRSHTIFIIYYKDLIKKISSKIYLCDLAGSERYDQRETYKSTHLNELKSINKSLSILGNVIHALSLKKPSHIPYKDSALTHLLQNSIGGNSKTYLIANISPSNDNFDESINTLHFADRAHEIESKLNPNIYLENEFDDDKDLNENKIIKKLSNEVKELRQILQLRTKRGTLDPIQEEFIKLKEENSQLKKYMHNNKIMKIIKENELLKQKIQKLSSHSVTKTSSSYNLNFNDNSNLFYFNDNYTSNKTSKNSKSNLDNNEIFSNLGSNIISDYNNYPIKNKKYYFSDNQSKVSSRTNDTNSKLIEMTNKRLKILDDLQKKNRLDAQKMINEVRGKRALNKMKLVKDFYFEN